MLLIIIIACVLLYLSISIISKYIKENHQQNDPMIKELKDILSPVFPGINDVKIYESEGKSYTINKEKVFLCLRDENNEYYNKNMLIYVLLHEYAHVVNKSVGHNEEFHEIFDNILEQAIDAKIYDPKIPTIEDYCNHKPE
jgi:hypothetical protein